MSGYCANLAAIAPSLIRAMPKNRKCRRRIHCADDFSLRAAK